MRKTHKKILGFAGLGLVSVVTTIAAVLPVPIASAVSTVTDTIQVIVKNDEPALDVTTTKPGTVTDPNYDFKAVYSNLTSATATLVNKDNDGNVIHTEEIWNEVFTEKNGEKDFALDLNNYGGYGNYTITVTGIGEGGVPVEQILSFKYTRPTPSPEPTDDGPVITIDPFPGEVITTVIVTIYDDNKQPTTYAPITIDNPSSAETIDLSFVNPKGWYYLQVLSKNSKGDILEEKWVHVFIKPADLDIVTPIPDIDGLHHITNTITNEAGQIVYQETCPNTSCPDITPGGSITWDLPDDLAPGLYTMTLQYFNIANEVLKTEVSTFIISDDSGHIILPITPIVDSVTTIETAIYDDKDGSLVRTVKVDRASGVAEVYDKDGNLIFTLPNALKNGNVIVIPMTGLPAGDYTAIISFKNKYGHLVGDTLTIKIHWDGDKAIIVPDTGSFLAGLNISREDYLITGLVVFMVIGVVAFGVVARNRRNRR